MAKENNKNKGVRKGGGMKVGDKVKVITPWNPYIFLKTGIITRVRRGFFMKYEVEIKGKIMRFSENEIILLKKTLDKGKER